PRHINNSMKSEEQRSKERRKTKTLIRSFAQREHAAEHKCRSDQDEHDRRPTDLTPEPNPIALRMESARVADRFGTEDGEDRFKVAETESAPRRCCNHPEGVMENAPAKIGGDTCPLEPAKMEPLERLTTHEQEDRQ